MPRLSRRKLQRIYQKIFIALTITCGVLSLAIFSTLAKEQATFQKGTTIRREYSKNFEGTSYHREFIQESDVWETFPNISIKLIDVEKNSDKYFYTNVIVHIDLKGAPPKAGYFLQLLELTAKSGATGVLIEWEDMFPWNGELEIVRSTNAYKISEVQGILRKARNLGLEVIPLVQTFGHMEWILKHEKFRALRENDNYPQVICIGNENSVKLVKKIISQVVNVHKPFGIKRFHIGADEGFQFGVCNESQKLARRLGSSTQLAIEYLGTIANYVKNITNGATILAWHDMIKQFIISGEVLSKLGTLLQPVIWDYSEELETMSTEDFLAFADNFPKMWASSAFKGANTPSSKYMDYEHYQKNNLQWITTQRLLRYNSGLAFEGMIITGWSRYDHMARLCEILPIGTPSMVLNTQIALIGAHKTLETSTVTAIVRKATNEAVRILNCDSKEGYFFEFQLNRCNFPGVEVYKTFQIIWRLNEKRIEEIIEKDQHIMGWLSPYNIRHNVSQKWYLSQIAAKLDAWLYILPPVAKSLEKDMRKLFHNLTVDEFFFDNIDPLVEKLTDYVINAQSLLNFETYKQRNFGIHRSKLALLS